MRRITTNILKEILFIVFVFLAVGISAQTTFYVSNNGDDSNVGTSTSTPWKTIAKVNSQTLIPGDRVLFEKGGVWRDVLSIEESGVKGNYIYYGNYGIGNNPRIFGSEIADNWTLTGVSNIWKSAGVFLDPRASRPSELFFVINDSTSWGDFQNYSADFANLSQEFDWTYNGSSVYVYSVSDPNSEYDFVEVPQRNQTVQMLDNNPEDFIEINGIDMLYGKSKGFYGGYPARNATNLIFRNCRIAYIGEKGGSSSYGLSVFHSNLLVENCLITDCGRRGISFNLYMLVDESSRRIIKNIVIRNNTFKRGYHTTSLDLASMGDRSVGERPDTISGVFFYSNYIDDSEIPMTREDEASNQLFTQQGGIIMKNIYVVNNVFIAATGRNILIEGGDSIFVWNNTINGHNQNGISSPYSNVSFNSSINNDYRNNILYQNLPDNSIQNYGVLMEHTPSNYLVKDYNLYYQEVENSNRGFNGGLHGYYNISNWTSYKSSNPLFDANSPSPQNPSFIDYSGGNYELKENSPAVAAGTSLSVIITDPRGKVDTIGKYDFSGVLRDSQKPSIGAFEFSNPDTTATDILYFELANQTGLAAVNISNHSVDIEVDYGTDITNLTPTITLSPGAVSNPISGVSRDFTSPQTYAVTSQDGSSQQNWVVRVTIGRASNETDISSITIPEQTGVAINTISHSASIQVPYGTNVTNLIPIIILSKGAICNPLSGVAKDFTTSISYLITAQDGITQQEWVVTVIIEEESGVNNRPVVDIAYEKSTYKGMVLTIDASSSYDADNESLSFYWNVPSDIYVSSLTKSSISILPTEELVYDIELSVSDGIDTVHTSLNIGVHNFNPSAYELMVSSIEASSYEEGNYPEYILDNNLETRWSSDGDNQWLVFELEEASTISHFELSFHGGEKRQAFFDIYASVDNLNWDMVLENSISCGFSPDMHAFEIPEQKASESYKYVKLVGHMNSKNTWNSFSEIKIYGNIQNATNSRSMELNLNDIVEVYPNPTVDNVYVKLGNESTVRVIDLSGAIVYEQMNANDIIEINYNFQSGVYFIQVTDNNKVISTKKLIVK